MINQLVETERRGNTSEYSILLDLFENMCTLNSNLLAFVVMHLSSQWMFKEKTKTLESLKRVFLTMIEREGDDSQTRGIMNLED